MGETIEKTNKGDVKPSASSPSEFDKSYEKHLKLANFNIRNKTRELSAFNYSVAEKMPRRARHNCERIKNLSDKIIEYVAEANFYPINNETTEEDYKRRIECHKRALLNLDFLDDAIEICYRNKQITDNQFTGSTKQIHYIRLYINNWKKSDEERYKKICSKTK